MKYKIQEKIEFICQFIYNPKLIGAILPSSKYVSTSIVGHGTNGYFEAIDYLLDNEK